MSEHPDRVAVERFARGEAGPEERRVVLRHLLAGCAVCRRAARALLSPSEGRDEAASDLSGALDRIQTTIRQREAMLALERAEAAELLAKLERHPLPRQLTLIRNSRKYSTLPLCEALIEAARERQGTDPSAAVERAEAAVAVAERMDPDRYGERLVADLQARAYAQHGNCLRRRGDLREADVALRRALERLEEGTGDPLEEAQVQTHLGALRAFQRRFGESVRWYNRAARTYRSVGETQRAARVLLAKADAVYYSGKLERAIAVARRALAEIDPVEDPRLHLIAQHNLALYLQEAGRLHEARAIAARIRPAFVRRNERIHLLHVRWLEGKIARDEGRPDEAEEAFREVRNGFLAAEMAYFAALVSLDLAALLSDRGRDREARDLATEMVAVFRAHRIHREAVAALIVFARAARQERLTADLVREVAAFLDRVQRDPAARFRK